MPKINDSEIQSLNKEVRRKKKTKKNGMRSQVQRSRFKVITLSIWYVLSTMFCLWIITISFHLLTVCDSKNPKKMILIRITFLLVKGIIFFEGTKNQEPILLIVFPFLTSCSQAHTSSHHIPY